MNYGSKQLRKMYSDYRDVGESGYPATFGMWRTREFESRHPDLKEERYDYVLDLFDDSNVIMPTNANSAIC